MIVLLPLLLACSAPRVLVIVTDTTRADLGGAPWPAWATPAAGARVYTEAWAPSSWTAPSTQALLTGGLVPWTPNDETPDAARCWAPTLSTDNLTAAIAARGACGNDAGRWVGDLYQRPGPRVDKLLSEAGDWRTEPVAVVQPLGPHTPLESGTLPDMADPMDPTWWTEGYRTANIDTLDRVGDLAAEAVAAGYLVVWTSDHGEALGEGGRWGHGLSLDDEQLRVPLVVLGAGVAPGWDDRPVSTLCVADTVRGDGCDLRTGADLREPVSAMWVGGEWTERRAGEGS